MASAVVASALASVAASIASIVASSPVPESAIGAASIATSLVLVPDGVPPPHATRTKRRVDAEMKLRMRGG